MADDPPILKVAPPLDPAWLQHEQEANLPALPPRQPPATDPPLQRQERYAAQCRERNAAMTAPGARDHHLLRGVTARYTTGVPSSIDGCAIPLLQYDLAAAAPSSSPTPPPPTPPPGDDDDDDDDDTGDGGEDAAAGPGGWVVMYYHGGGLQVGEADSEDLTCRRIVLESRLPRPVRLYSAGYRLMPLHTASTALQDCADALDAVVARERRPSRRVLVVGSSSGGEMAALVTQRAAAAGGGCLHGVVLRCPVTSDAFSGPEYVPEGLRGLHTSAWERSFDTSLLGFMGREVPRDGLERMPLEAREGDLVGMPRTWIQVCTNDVLYSDGVCYARALGHAGVEVRVDVVWGWPHTFWLKAPHLPRALEADRAMLDGIAWVAAGLED